MRPKSHKLEVGAGLFTHICDHYAVKMLSVFYRYETINAVKYTYQSPAPTSNISQIIIHFYNIIYLLVISVKVEIICSK
jgi:hypothetical protein